MRQALGSEVLDPYAPPAAVLDSPQLPPDACGLVLADRQDRFYAFMLDVAAHGAACLPGAMLVAGGSVQAGVALVVCATVTLTIYQWFLTASSGQSLGKRWIGIRIVHASGRPCGFIDGVVVRIWLPAALAYGAGLLLGSSAITLFRPSGASINPLFLCDAALIFGASRRCLHDRLAGTLVVRVSA
jgi:uncharacterized RDD family membrane protein YckC